ncbi:formin-J-like [Parasteatoda tepidariorum]|uniref:formin-J-like n=1 Tax=Parasteatoda tepidariorum TaxID=114398 RepID=UPI001C718AAF|nr:uncharacterized protein LOC122270214 [Parasteatoda tepidariorum]XP_042902731.1 uncharacterized protein LOC122270214 [Parasteatoda tepidariorum]
MEDYDINNVDFGRLLTEEELLNLDTCINFLNQEKENQINFQDVLTEDEQLNLENCIQKILKEDRITQNPNEVPKMSLNQQALLQKPLAQWHRQQPQTQWHSQQTLTQWFNEVTPKMPFNQQALPQQSLTQCHIQQPLTQWHRQQPLTPHQQPSVSNQHFYQPVAASVNTLPYNNAPLGSSACFSKFGQNTRKMKKTHAMDRRKRPYCRRQSQPTVAAFENNCSYVSPSGLSESSEYFSKFEENIKSLERVYCTRDVQSKFT